MNTLAVSMIVRDAEAGLAACLGSVRPFAHEIVIADTGSHDRSIAIARDYGARVIEIPWEDDFSKARNFSLAQVESDWVLSIDADERLDGKEACRLRALMAGDAAGYQVTIRNYVLSASERIWDRPAQPNDGRLAEASPYPAYVEHQNVRVFRRDPAIHFVHRVHESVGPTIQRSGKKLGDAGFLLHHFGLALAGDARSRKNELYRRMGQAKVKDNPRDAQAHFELGLEEFEHFNNAPAALDCFETATKLNSRLQVAWLFRGLACLKLGRDAEALECLQPARRGKDTALISESVGDAHYNLGNNQAAERAYRRALQLAPESPTVESKLGLTQVRAGREEQGISLLLRAIEHAPGQAHLYDRLVAATVSLNRIEDAAATAECKLLNTEPDPDSFLRAAALRARSGDPSRATELLTAGVARFPEAPKLRQGLNELQS